MSDINYFVLTVVDCAADYRPTFLPMVGRLAEELKEKAGAALVRYGFVATGDNPGAVVLFQAYEKLDGFEKAMEVYAASDDYAKAMASGKIVIRLRNLMKVHPIPFESQATGDMKYLVLTRIASADPLIDTISSMAGVFADAGAITFRYGTLITGSNVGNRLLGVTYPSLAAVEKAYDALGADPRYQALLEKVDVNMRNIVRLV